MANEKSTLNLDEIFGLSNIPTVRWEGREYDLLPPEALGPREFLLYDQLKGRADALRATPNKALGEEETQNLERFTQDLLEIICPELAAKNLVFMARVAVLTFYNEQVGRRDKAQKKGAKRRTGASSIRAWLSGMAWGLKLSRTPHSPPSEST
jgi:hypothetical protein